MATLTYEVLIPHVQRAHMLHVINKPTTKRVELYNLRVRECTDAGKPLPLLKAFALHPADLKIHSDGTVELLPLEMHQLQSHTFS